MIKARRKLIILKLLLHSYTIINLKTDQVPILLLKLQMVAEKEK